MNLQPLRQKARAVGEHAYHLKSTLTIMVCAFLLLMFELPADAPPPRWLTAVWALAKTALGVVFAYLILIETAPYIRMQKLLNDFYGALQRDDPRYAIALAIVFTGAVLALAIMTHAIIPSIAEW